MEAFASRESKDLFLLPDLRIKRNFLSANDQRYHIRYSLQNDARSHGLHHNMGKGHIIGGIIWMGSRKKGTR